MKNSLKYLVLALGAALLTLPALRAEETTGGTPAGGPGDGRREMRREKMGDHMAEELGLSAEQKAQFKEINQQEKAELEALHKDTAMAKEDRHAKAEAIRKSYMEKRQALMTPEQREKAGKMREKMEKRREERQEKPVAK